MCAAHDLRPASLFGKFSISGFLRNVTQSEEISHIERWLVLKINAIDNFKRLSIWKYITKNFLLQTDFIAHA